MTQPDSQTEPTKVSTQEFDVEEALKDDPHTEGSTAGCVCCTVLLVAAIIIIVAVVLTVKTTPPAYGTILQHQTPTVCLTVYANNKTFNQTTFKELLFQDIYINPRFYAITRNQTVSNLTLFCFSCNLNVTESDGVVIDIRLSSASSYRRIQSVYGLYTDPQIVTDGGYPVLPTAKQQQTMNVTLAPSWNAVLVPSDGN